MSKAQVDDSVEAHDANDMCQVVSVRDLRPSVLSIYGTSLITVIGHIGKSRNDLSMRSAVMRFLAWLSSVGQPGKPEYDVMVGLCDEPPSRPSFADASDFLQAFNSVVARWSREGTEGDGRPLKAATQSTLFRAFDELAGQHPGVPLAFSRFRIPDRPSRFDPMKREAELASVYGSPLIDAIKSYSEKTADFSMRLGAFRFLEWVRVNGQPGSPAHAVLLALSNQSPTTDAVSSDYAQTFVQVFTNWQDNWMANRDGRKPTSIGTAIRSTVRIFVFLAGKLPGIPPTFDRRSIRTSVKRARTAPLPGEASLKRRIDSLLLGQELARVYDPTLIGAIVLYGTEKKSRAAVNGTFRFLDWLRTAARPETVEHDVFAGLCGKEAAPSDAGTAPVALKRAFYDLLLRWQDHCLNNLGALKRTTAELQIRSAFSALASLAPHHPGIPQDFDRSSLRTTKTITAALSLGQAEWPDLKGLHGDDRERAALRIARAEFCAVFEAEEGAFRIGQAILAGGVPNGADAHAVAQVRTLLQSLHHDLANLGNIGYRRLMAIPHFWNDPANDTQLWQAAGIPVPDTVLRPLGGPHIALFGPSRRLLTAAVGIIVCDTGWNVQPTLDLASNPFVFRSSEQDFLATSGFIESFKNRAGHHVLAYLGEGDTLSGGKLTAAREVWNAAVDADVNPADPQHAVVPAISSSGTPSARDILARFRIIADAVRNTLAPSVHSPNLATSFWLYISDKGVAKPTSVNIHGLPIRPESTFRAIRRTVQIIRFDQCGSVGAVTRAGGHAGNGTMMPHYLNAPHVVARLDRSIRDFQNAMQGIITRDLDQEAVSKALGLTGQALQDMCRYAERAGISAALGLMQAPANAGAAHAVIRFATLDDRRLSDLYLAHRALRDLQSRTKNHARYARLFLPMLALTKAIGRELFRNGYGPHYVKAARVMSVALREGTVALPFLGE